VNLSVTGARVRDVLDDQLPRLHAIGIEPDLVTLLIGANDMLVRSRRIAAIPTCARLIDELPPGRTVIGTLPRRNREALAINALIDAATLAEDHFHPNERGYARIAGAFVAASRSLR
jgi:lysophospholipase L1-like esterase